jgi:hypothetical protein
VLRIIRDDGTPHSLPAWARDEIVSHRLGTARAVEALIDGDTPRALEHLGYGGILDAFATLEAKRAES